MRVSAARQGLETFDEAEAAHAEADHPQARETDGRRAEGKTIAEIGQRPEISEPTFHRGRHQYGGSEHDQNGSAYGDDVKRSR